MASLLDDKTLAESSRRNVVCLPVLHKLAKGSPALPVGVTRAERGVDGETLLDRAQSHLVLLIILAVVVARKEAVVEAVHAGQLPDLPASIPDVRV